MSAIRQSGCGVRQRLYLSPTHRPWMSLSMGVTAVRFACSMACKRQREETTGAHRASMTKRSGKDEAVVQASHARTHARTHLGAGPVVGELARVRGGARAAGHVGHLWGERGGAEGGPFT